MKMVATLLVGAALGFGGGWLIFDPRFGGQSDAAKIQQAVADRAAQDVPKAPVVDVSCVKAVAPAGTWTCQVGYSNSGGAVTGYMVTGYDGDVGRTVITRDAL